MTDFPKRMSCRDGVLVFEDCSEVCLWGNNFQPNLYWEYKFRMEHMGLSADAETMKRLADEGFEELRRFKADLIRCHLPPADFVDADGNLVENLWLDMLCYVIAKARENETYVYLTFINTMEWALIEDSFVVQGDRSEWTFRPDLIARSFIYIRQLINYINPYTGIALKDDPVIAVWEPINEPKYITFEQTRESAEHSTLFRNWAAEAGVSATETNYPDYQHDMVLAYINGVRRLLLDEDTPHRFRLQLSGFDPTEAELKPGIHKRPLRRIRGSQ